jgi:hypothetical protein
MKKAVLTANYGEKGDGEGKCKACEYFCTPKDMPDCGLEKTMGYCEIYDFMCNQNNGCDAWEAIGKEEEMEMENEE